jgi:hypothetical protein
MRITLILGLKDMGYELDSFLSEQVPAALL